MEARVFAYLDIEHPPVAWAVMRGALVSADHVPGGEESCVSFMVAGLIQHQLNWRMSNEAAVEHVRSTQFPERISRLRGLYFFENRDLARIAIDQRWGGHFATENLVELRLHTDRPTTRVDANWITDAPRMIDGRLDLSNLAWISKYWSGEQRGDRPCWETIASGAAVILDSEVRSRAYELVKREFPKCWEFIEMSRLASEAGTDGGLVTPMVLRMQGAPSDLMRLTYALYDAPLKDPAVVAEMAKHPDFPRLAAYANEHRNEDLISPDFTPWNQTFSLGVQGQIGAEAIIESVHHTEVVAKP